MLFAKFLKCFSIVNLVLLNVAFAGMGTLSNPIAEPYVSYSNNESQPVAIYIGRDSTQPATLYAVQHFDKDKKLVYTNKNLKVELLNGWSKGGYAILDRSAKPNEIRSFKVATVDSNGNVGTYSAMTNIVRVEPATFSNAPVLKAYKSTGSITYANAEVAFDLATPGTQTIAAVEYSVTYATESSSCKTYPGTMTSGIIMLSSNLIINYGDNKTYGITLGNLIRKCKFKIQIKPYNYVYNSTSAVQSGSYYTTLTLDVPAASAPSTPAKPTAVAGYASVSLSWKAPTSDGGSAVSKYSIYKDGKVLLTVDGLKLSTTITGLNSAQSYSFQVSAHNATGESVKSAASDPVAPLATTKPSMPLEVTAINFNSKEIIIKWKTPESNGGLAITSYGVYDKANSVRVATVNVADIQSNEITLTNLIEGKNYSFYMKAVNSNGSGDPSNTSNVVAPKKVYCEITVSGTVPTKTTDALVLDIKSDGIALLYYSFMYNNISGSNQNGTLIDGQGKPILNYQDLYVGTLAAGSWVFTLSGKGTNGYSYSCQPSNIILTIK